LRTKAQDIGLKIYRTKAGVIIEREKALFLLEKEIWDSFINDDHLYEKALEHVKSEKPTPNGATILQTELQSPIQSQELWAAGVTYQRSKVGRQEESKKTGGGDFYARVYEADRPELFFKGTAHRIVGHAEKVKLRKDSEWNVPEPELTLLVTSSGKIVGYTIGNDMSSRSIEGENPLYLPQAKTYDGCAALGPCIFVTQKPLPKETEIRLEVKRGTKSAFAGSVELGQMKRSPEELVSYLYRECSFPHGSMLMTGTGIVPTTDFTLTQGDVIRISIDPIGTLENVVA
jgi:2-dehydro-3-deoxy-D-arabinonate dehydratase